LVRRSPLHLRKCSGNGRGILCGSKGNHARSNGIHEEAPRNSEDFGNRVSTWKESFQPKLGRLLTDELASSTSATTSSPWTTIEGSGQPFSSGRGYCEEPGRRLAMRLHCDSQCTKLQYATSHRHVYKRLAVPSHVVS
jgi:hypothetical protein